MYWHSYQVLIYPSSYGFSSMMSNSTCRSTRARRHHEQDDTIITLTDVRHTQEQSQHSIQIQSGYHRLRRQRGQNEEQPDAVVTDTAVSIDHTRSHDEHTATQVRSVSPIIHLGPSDSPPPSQCQLEQLPFEDSFMHDLISHLETTTG
jgi:hypothetical protein